MYHSFSSYSPSLYKVDVRSLRRDPVDYEQKQQVDRSVKETDRGRITNVIKIGSFASIIA